LDARAMTKVSYETWQRCLAAGLIPSDVRYSFKNPYPTKADEQQMGILMLQHEIGIVKAALDRNLHNTRHLRGRKDSHGAIGQPSYKPVAL